MKTEEELMDDLAEKLNDSFEGFLEDIQDDPRFVRPITENDYCPDEEWTFVYTRRGMRLVENFQRRLYSIFHKYFPDGEIEIESNLYQEE